ncbi:MAG: hypothetical protein HY222_01675 [Thaumarchaeota archaeon]|nr:hypothetical protein [Nitrososphaerota archaeon]MBI3641084.1 hypothetical protein [Nitrososphaerota archaeon]
MKTLPLVMIIIASSMLVLNWTQVEGRIVSQTVMQLYKESDIILVGNVTSVEIDSSGIHTFYHVKVEQYLKSPQQNDTIIAVGSGPNGGHGPPDPKFMMGDRVRLYLYKEDGMYMISMYSTIANPKCYAHELLGLGPRESIPGGEDAPNYSERNCGPPFQFSSYPHTVFLPPTIQFQSGIQAASIACNEGFELIIKNENNLPACVKPEHLARLAQYGWTIPNLKIIGDTDIINNDILSESNCGQFYTIPENKSNSNEIPVLILQQNSTGCAKITFTVNFLFNNTNDCIGCNSQMVKTAEFLSIGKYNFSRHGDLISGSSGKDYTHSFQITAVPKTVDISKYPIGSNFTVVFIIKPLPNATGFYDYSIAKPVCNAYPLAVGYSPDQVNSSDFSEGLGFMQNHPCAMGPYGFSPVQISGMNYVQMKLD